MEKVVYVLWKSEGEALPDFSRKLIDTLPHQLLALGVEKLQVNVMDEAVAAGQHLSFNPMRPAPSGMVSFWLNAAHDRHVAEEMLEQIAPRIAGYAVAESTVLPNTESPDQQGRVRGFSQLAFMFKLSAMTRDGFLQIWMREQTRCGLETQDSFYYCQNIVTRVLTPGAPMWDGIVEECYATEAMTDPLVFWKANGSEEVYRANYAREMETSARFLDLENISVMITSCYRFQGWTDSAQISHRSSR